VTRDARRRARLARVVALGARIASPADPLAEETRRALLASSGLSPEGVALALARSLDVEVSEADLDALLASSGSAPRCYVLLSANVCTAALRAVALAVATAPRVVVRPSRRDPALARILARELSADEAFRAEAGEILLAEELTPAPGDELHLYGSDATLADVRGRAPAGVVIRAHGSGFGLALIGTGAELTRAARDLAADVVLFDQRGCLSPRAALVEGGAARAVAFAEALHEALEREGEHVPRGPQGDEVRAEIALYAAAIDAVGQSFPGPHHLVGVDLAPRALALPPPARVVHVAPASAAAATALVAPFARHVTALGSAGPSAIDAAVAPIIPFARRSPLGAMQRPPLDGPVDRRGRGDR
jgi:Acyl-CoA reductase (LuxC)